MTYCWKVGTEQHSSFPILLRTLYESKLLMAYLGYRMPQVSLVLGAKGRQGMPFYGCSQHRCRRLVRPFLILIFRDHSRELCQIIRHRTIRHIPSGVSWGGVLGYLSFPRYIILVFPHILTKTCMWLYGCIWFSLFVIHNLCTLFILCSDRI